MTIQPNPDCEYDNNGAWINAPGKFQAEPVFAPYYWNLGLEGFADKDDGKTYTFKVSTDDFAKWPTLKAYMGRRRRLRLSEDSQGFVHCF